MILDLRKYLDGPAFLWLAATAVYPELRYDITVILGLKIRDLSARGSPPVFNEDRLARIVGLPWFRGGRYPNWVRRMLLHALDPGVRRQAQDAVAELIAQARKAADGADTKTNLSSSEPNVAQAGITRFPIWRRARRGDRVPLDAVTAELIGHGGRDDLMPLLTGRPLSDLSRATTARLVGTRAFLWACAGLGRSGLMGGSETLERSPCSRRLAAYLDVGERGGNLWDLRLVGVRRPARRHALPGRHEHRAQDERTPRCDDCMAPVGA